MLFRLQIVRYNTLNRCYYDEGVPPFFFYTSLTLIKEYHVQVRSSTFNGTCV